MVTVSDIHCRNLRKDLCDTLDRLFVLNDPERVTESFRSGYEVILRCALGHFCHDSIKVIPVRVGEEYRFHVGIQRTYMFHAVFLFVLTRQLMFLNASLQIVIYPSADNQTILRLAKTRLSVNVVFLLLVLFQPTFDTKTLVLRQRLLIHTRVMLIGTGFKIDLRLDDMIQTHLVAFRFLTCLLGVQYVIRPTTHFGHQLFRWPYSLKWFYFHKIQIILISIHEPINSLGGVFLRMGTQKSVEQGVSYSEEFDRRTNIYFLISCILG